MGTLDVSGNKVPLSPASAPKEVKPAAGVIELEAAGIGKFILSKESASHIKLDNFSAKDSQPHHKHIPQSAVSGVKDQQSKSVKMPDEKPEKASSQQEIRSLSDLLLQRYAPPEELDEAHRNLDKFLDYAKKEYSFSDLEGLYTLCLEAIDEMESSSKKSCFPLRFALMEKIVQERSYFPSWKVFIKNSASVKNVWTHAMKLENWVPEMQEIMRHQISMGLIRGSALMNESKHRSKLLGQEDHPTLELAKGGFGAGKTTFLRDEYGDAANGVVAPDKEKGLLKQLIPHATSTHVHIQSSVIAQLLTQRLIDDIEGRVAYDSAMTDPNLVAIYIEKARAGQKEVVINDIVRSDLVRALGVLHRGVGGEDPNIPPAQIISSSAEEYATRPQCLAFATAPGSMLGSKVPEKIEYCLYVGDADGGFADRGVRISYLSKESGYTVEYIYSAKHNPAKEAAERNEIDARLQTIGVKVTGDILSCYQHQTVEAMKVSKRKELCALFKQPVSSLMTGPASQVKLMTRKNEERLLIPAREAKECRSWEEFSHLIKNSELREAFVAALENLRTNIADDLYTAWDPQSALHAKLQSGQAISYLDIPLSLALEVNAVLKNDPW